MNLVELAQNENIKLLVQSIKSQPNAEELFAEQIRKLTAVIDNKNKMIRSQAKVIENLKNQLGIREI